MPKFSQEHLFQLFTTQVKNNHRTIFVVIGEGTKYQIPTLHDKLSKSSILSSVIWLYKNAETYMDRESKKIKVKEEDTDFFKWIKTQDPEYITYKESKRILGRTCDMLVLQDFEAMTPNMIACAIETVKGGGAIVLLIDREKTINEIINKTPATEAQVCTGNEFVPRFNRRIFKLLTQLGYVIFFDSKLRIMDITKEVTLTDVKRLEVFNNTEEHPLLHMCKTADQLRVLKGLINLANQNDDFVSSILAARGRGKSVALGFTVAYALKTMSSIAISALFLENVQEIFNFTIHGLNKLGYKKATDYKVIFAFEGKRRLINRIEVTRDVKRFVEFVYPQDQMKFYAELLVIDEAASIPLPQLKNLINCRRVLMASTANGYEGTGRVFRTKLADFIKEKAFNYSVFEMFEPIRYSRNDPVEEWLGKALILDPKIQNITNCPIPAECSLYFVNKDALFVGNAKTEGFLEDVFSLFVSSHYRNSPDDIQILSDSLNHEIFVLLTPQSKVVCAIQIAFEGKCIKSSINKNGNLIPWVIHDNYYNDDFITQLGARVVRIAVHPSLLSMGYGSHALKTLISCLESSAATQNNVQCNNTAVLLHPLDKIQTPKIEWVGTSFGVNEKLFNFWKKLGFFPICIKQLPSKTTGEFSTVLLKNNAMGFDKMSEFFLQRFVNLLSGPFRNMPPTLVLSLIYSTCTRPIGKAFFFTEDEKDRIKRFAKGTIDIRSVLDILPGVSKYFFCQRDINRISMISQVAFVLIGCQCKTSDEACRFLDIEHFKLVNLLAISIQTILDHYSGVN